MSQDAPKQTSGLAIAGLVLAILAAATSFLPIINNLSFFIALIGAALALVAYLGARRGKHTATGMSLAGLIVSIVSIAIVLVTQAAYSAALSSVADSLKTDDTPVATTETPSPADTAAPAEDTPAPSEETPAPAEETPAEPAPAEEPPAEQDLSALAVGQAVTYDSGLSVSVVGVERGLTKYDGSPVTCITVTYTNAGSGNESFNALDWKGEDANGVQRTYTFVTDGTNELHSGSLAPGGTVTGNIYLEGDITRAIYVENFWSDKQVGWVL